MNSLTFKPDPPVVGKVTHHSIELSWIQIKDKMGSNMRIRYTLQETDKNKHEWGNVYSGYGVTKVVEGLEPLTEYSFRIAFTTQDNQKSEYSQICTVRTTKEPVTGEALHKAINLNRKAEVEQILQTPDACRLVGIPDKFGNYPLMNAVLKDNLELVEILLDNGAEANAQNESGKTAMMLAAFGGKVKIIQRLKYSGGSYDQCDRSGSSAIHYAIDGGHLECIQWLLLDGVSSNKQDASFGWTPLIRAASINSSKEIAELLLKFGANINSKDKDGKTALMIAVINGNQPFVEALVDHGADLEFKNEYGKTAYDLAVSMDRRRVIKYLDDYNNNKLQAHKEQIPQATTSNTSFKSTLIASNTSLKV